MSKNLFIFLITCCAGSVQAQVPPAGTSETLTNANVIGMVKAGLSPDVILTTIRAAGCAFQFDADNLNVLKQAGVPDPIVRAMAAKECQPPNPAKPPANPALGSIQGTLTWESKVRGHTTGAGEIVLLKGTMEIPVDRTMLIIDKKLGVSAPPDEACNAARKGSTMETFNSKLQTLALCGRSSFDSIRNHAGADLYDIEDQTASDAKGHFEISNITPGEYTVVIWFKDAKALTLRDMIGKVTLLHVKIESGMTVDATQDFGRTEF